MDNLCFLSLRGWLQQAEAISVEHYQMPRFPSHNSGKRIKMELSPFFNSILTFTCYTSSGKRKGTD